MQTAWQFLSWFMLLILALAAAFAVDIVVALVLFVHLPDSWDLTGRYFSLTVPLAQFIVLVPVLAAGAVFGMFRVPRMLVFWVVAVAFSVYQLYQFSNPAADIARYQLTFTLWCVVAFALVFVLRRR